MKLSTDHLDLIAATLDLVQAELESPEHLASQLCATVEPGWPPGEYDQEAQEFFRDRLAEGGEAARGWYNWYAVQRPGTHQPSIIVGAGGYFGPPSEDGEAEIGFSVMPSWQGRGFATEIAGALIQNAFRDRRVQRVVAHTTAANPASRRVLEKCGFAYVARDEDAGNLYFEIQR